ncbi:antitoxin VbhA family protein [Curtobacterium sp. MCBD17_040]|uniref:antitoxin VbhA family protein n=1 Tax=Curtobacterium sp. MCBD17_040 TaxID=2175674 RepID=UPI000DA83411|nr:antitoxin VbhA family protein [Curtobacterium sp. MCBD17_040]WIB65555.1 antitoxin VbhA family protein [Curtobacterium sp. MCBD17_040]
MTSTPPLRISAEESARRREIIDEGVRTLALEGLAPSPSYLEQTERFIAGELDIAGLIEAARAQIVRA